MPLVMGMLTKAMKETLGGLTGFLEAQANSIEREDGGRSFALRSFEDLSAFVELARRSNEQNLALSSVPRTGDRHNTGTHRTCSHRPSCPRLSRQAHLTVVPTPSLYSIPTGGRNRQSTSTRQGIEQSQHRPRCWLFDVGPLLG
jgi:hypothetical protein